VKKKPSERPERATFVDLANITISPKARAAGIDTAIGAELTFRALKHDSQGHRYGVLKSRLGVPLDGGYVPLETVVHTDRQTNQALIFLAEETRHLEPDAATFISNYKLTDQEWEATKEKLKTL